MPIRTHRGRAAVYRRLWAWPLRSPKHLVAAVLLVVAAGAVIAYLLPQGVRTLPQAERDHTGQPVEHSAVVPPVTTHTPAPPTISVPTSTPAPTPPDPQGLKVVEEWGRAWVTHPPGSTKQQWLDALRPHTTDEFITVMQTVEPANAGSAITGPVTPISSTATAMKVSLPTDIGVLNVRVIKTPDGWKVAGYDREG
ncbi:hypothetical protein [Saccharopolyspora rectivirgula]|jgi:hypothetical protein|uniref:Uncharacterized protein n=1 Tax=Saccharopolyspora rectivirgula TaxID=28042 RepID=A0A073BC55_9PSEU|nr:hypothetical protein [Saccharopolyspora rectivirgula]KEI45354.1 hypothetical protein GU90_04395 [Saccharopolyspora rectivirgula]